MASPWITSDHRSRYGVALDEPTLEAARKSALAVPSFAPILTEAKAYAPWSWRPELDQRPTLQLDDVSAIPFLVDISGVDEYQHRARLRAADGDSFAAVTPETTGFSEYCAGPLALGGVSFVQPEPVGSALAVARACAEGSAFEQIVEVARWAGGLDIHPYMGIEAVWQLARRLGEAAGVVVRVIAPPPPITWLANDKAQIEDLVEAILGRQWLVESRRGRSPKSLAESLLGLADRHHRVALKRLRCASAMGNEVYESRSLKVAGVDGVEALVDRFLRRTEWTGDEEVLAVAWEETDLSPSTQLWIPPLGDGPPRLDGIYEQILQGDTRVFVGSRPSGLSDSIHEQLGVAALEVAAGLQALGYIGRCSFDHLVVGDPDGDYVLRFTECNGRWGGTSTPMSLVDRLFPEQRPPYRAQDIEHPDLVGVPFPEVLRRTGDLLFDARRGTGRYLFYNVGPLAGFGKLDVVVVGESQADAELAMTEELPAVLGLVR